MATAVIASITGTPTLATKNSAGVLVKPGVQLTIWDPLHNYDDGTGSTAPITFRTPTDPNQPYSPRLIVNLAVTFTSQYSGSSFNLEGYIILPNGTELKVLNSEATMPPSPLPNPPVPIPYSISHFQFDNALHLGNSAPVPLRISADFRWRLTFMGLPAIVSQQSTRLEICYARAAAPIGPSYTMNPFLSQTRLNLNGIYPIGLLRLFFPAPSEFTGIAKFWQPANYAPWYAARVVYQVWTWGNPQGLGKPQYDALNGGSYYNMSRFGGGFNLQDWLAVTSKILNCYDLAAIVQLGCCLLLTSNGEELLDSRWVYQVPNGFINPCVLYGWGQTYPYPPGVNNPFFLNSNPPNPYVPPGTAGRAPFGNHAWIEVLHDPNNIGYRTVLDATTAAFNGNICWPDDGSRSRVTYAQVHIDKAADPTGASTGNLNDKVLPGPSNGNCYTNYSFYTTSPTYPQGALGRVGVFNADGIVPPQMLEGVIASSPGDTLMSETEILLVKGRNPDAPTSNFNNASIRKERLVELISESSNDLSLAGFGVKVTEGTAVVTARFTGAKYTDSISATLLVEIHAFDNFPPAIIALIHVLNSFTPPCRLSENFNALSTPLAEIALIDVIGQNLFFVRGNYCVYIRLIPDSVVAPDPDIKEPLEPHAQKLDAFFAASTLPSGQQRVPSIDLKVPAPTEVKVGESFILEASHEYAATDGASSNGTIVICAGPTTEVNSGVEFFALAEGEVELSLNVAHRETLIPVTGRWKVSVEDSPSA